MVEKYSRKSVKKKDRQLIMRVMWKCLSGNYLVSERATILHAFVIKQARAT